MFFNDRINETVLLSDRHGFRLYLPGRWRYVRGKDIRGPYRTREMQMTVGYLKQKRIIITLGADIFSNAYYMRDLKGLVSLWDLRRSLSNQRKSMLHFKRNTHRLSEYYCGDKGKVFSRSNLRETRYYRKNSPGNRRYQKSGQCILLKSSLQSRRKKFRFIEFLYLKDFYGFYLGISHTSVNDKTANTVMNNILRRIHFSSSHLSQ